MPRIKVAVSNVTSGAVFVNEVRGTFRSGSASFRLQNGLDYQLKLNVTRPPGTIWTFTVTAQPGYKIVPSRLNNKEQERRSPAVARMFKVVNEG